MFGSAVPVIVASWCIGACKQCKYQVCLPLQAEVDALEQQLFAIAQRRFNLDSPKECSAVIFDELGLGKGKGIKKTKSGYYSTSM